MMNVLVYCPRINWKLVVIEGLTTGNDGMVRSANIRTKTGVTNRPVSKLYPLEVTANEATSVRSQATEEPDNQDDESAMNSSAQVPVCQRRKVAEQAHRQIREWVKCIHGPPEDVGVSD